MSTLTIRALTTAIQLLQPESTPTEAPVQARPPNYQALSKAYNHLATLLTQGLEAGTGRQVVAVTGNFSSSGISISALEDLDEIPSIKHMPSKENPDKGSGDGTILTVQEIKPSTASLNELADPSMYLPTRQILLSGQSTPHIPLAKHASDLFKALIDFSNDRRNCFMPFFQFVWLRCHYKIKHRLAADEVMLGKSLHILLGEWKLKDTDVVKEQWFRVDPRLYQRLDSVNICIRLPDETKKREYEFSRSTIPAWCAAFINVIKDLKNLAAMCDMQVASTTQLNQVFVSLYGFVYGNKAFETLLALPSLVTAVNTAMSDAEQKRRSQRREKSFHAPPLDDAFDAEDTNANPMLRCYKATLAWLRAGISLSHSKLLHEPLPTFHIIHSYLPSGSNTSMMKLENLMKKVILPRLKHVKNIDNEAFIHKLLEREDFAHKSKFSGTIHCEATLMALVHSFTSAAPKKRVPPFTKEETQKLMPLFSGADRVVGVGKKSCFCCYWLAQWLDGAFLVPGTHGIVYPWTPPVFGVPESVLKRLEEKLTEKLVTITEAWIADHPVAHASRQSSLALSSDGDLDDFDAPHESLEEVGRMARRSA